MVVLQLNITVILHQTITGTPHAQVTANHSKYTQATTSAHIQHISNAYGCAEWPRQGPPSHLTRETISGRRPVDGAGTPGGVFCPGENIPLGRRRGYSLRSTFPLGGMHHAAKLDRTSLISDGFQRHPQTLSSPPPQGQVFAGTKDSAKCIGPVHWPAATECLTR